MIWSGALFLQLLLKELMFLSSLLPLSSESLEVSWVVKWFYLSPCFSHHSMFSDLSQRKRFSHQSSSHGNGRRRHLTRLNKIRQASSSIRCCKVKWSLSAFSFFFFWAVTYIYVTVHMSRHIWLRRATCSDAFEGLTGCPTPPPWLNSYFHAYIKIKKTDE